MLSNLTKLAMAVGKALEKKSWKLVTAESCTGGWVGQAITAIPGSSAWFDSGFITYSYESKTKLLDVSTSIIQKYGAVSEEVVRLMAEGALKNSNAQTSLAITGIAGPTGGIKEKPVGTVWFAWAGDNFETQSVCQYFTGNRNQIRAQAVEFSLTKLIVNIETVS